MAGDLAKALWNISPEPLGTSYCIFHVVHLSSFWQSGLWVSGSEFGTTSGFLKKNLGFQHEFNFEVQALGHMSDIIMVNILVAFGTFL